MDLAVLLLLLATGVEIALGDKIRRKLQELKEIKAILGDMNQAIQKMEAEPGTYVPEVCPKRLETRTKRTACHDVETNGISGVYTVNITGTPTRVYCDMSTDGGGWIVFQRRMDGSVNFNRNWADYSKGFGDLAGEFWLGNELLHTLTSSGSYQMLIDMADKDGNCKKAVYSKFRVESEDDQYRLARLGVYSGNAGDALRYHEGQMFSTRDQDHDATGNTNCGKKHKAGWWFNSCLRSNLNGVYDNNNNAKGVNWKSNWKGYSYSLPFTEMKIRPN